jgi:hypothetical protein
MHLLAQHLLQTQMKTPLLLRQHQHLLHVLQHLWPKIHHLMWMTLRQQPLL